MYIWYGLVVGLSDSTLLPGRASARARGVRRARARARAGVRARGSTALRARDSIHTTAVDDTGRRTPAGGMTNQKIITLNY